MAETKYTPGLTQLLVLAYRRHEAWARRSGFAPMEWPDFKRSRAANPLAMASIATSGTQADGEGR
jgi:hypothetical protein